MAKLHGYEVHSFAAQFPMMPDADLKALAANIEANGQHEKIIVRDSDGVLVDGRNRLEACYRAGVPPLCERRELTESETVELIASLNLERRHLTESQRAMLGASYADWLQQCKQDDSVNNEEEEMKTCKNSAENGGSDFCANLPKSKPAHRPNARATESVSAAAEKFNVSERSVKSAKKIAAEAPDLAEKVKAGEITVHKAEKELKARKEPEKPVVKDGLGLPIPDYLAEPFAAVDRFKAIESVIRDLAQKLHECASAPGGQRLASDLRTKGDDEKVRYFSEDLDKVKRVVKFGRPYTRCPYCYQVDPRKPNKTCKCCKGQGWVPKPIFDSSPDDYRAALEKLVK